MAAPCPGRPSLGRQAQKGDRTRHSSAAPRQGPESRQSQAPFPSNPQSSWLRVRGSSGSSGVGGGRAVGRGPEAAAHCPVDRRREGLPSLYHRVLQRTWPTTAPRRLAAVWCAVSAAGWTDKVQGQAPPPTTYRPSIFFAIPDGGANGTTALQTDTEAGTKAVCTLKGTHTASQRTGIRTAVSPAAHPSPACSTPLHSGPGPAATVPTAPLSPAW